MSYFLTKKNVYLTLLIAALIFTACRTNRNTDNQNIANIDYPAQSVVFNANGAVGSAPTVIGVVMQNTSIILPGPGNLAMRGKQFYGWTTARDGSGDVFHEGSRMFVGSSDIELYAKWIEGITINSIISPYASVNWNTALHLRAALHSHTTNSDGRNLLSDTIEHFYAQSYDIVGITEHNYEFHAGRQPQGQRYAVGRWQPYTDSWVYTEGDDENVPFITRNGLTQARYNQIATGADRGGRGLLRVPLSTEIAAWPNEFNAFFFRHDWKDGASSSWTNDRNFRTRLTTANEFTTREYGHAIMFINHPGRSTRGMDEDGPNSGIHASSNPHYFKRYARYFMDFPHLVGFEIINRDDVDSRTDRVLWDNILRQTTPHGRNVFGFSNDDSHSNSEIGRSWNIFLANRNTLDEFKSAMMTGNFYAVARQARRERGGNIASPGLDHYPKISKIDVDNAAMTITITVEDGRAVDRIDWIYDNRTIATGGTIKLRELPVGDIGHYVRANIIGPGGVSFTQPFLLDITVID